MRLSNRSWIFPSLSLLLVASSLMARADVIYNFTITTGSTSTTPGSTFSVTGTLNGTQDPSNASIVHLTSVTGSGQGYGFSGVVPLGTYPSISYNNLLYTDPNVPHVDSQGVLLYLTSSIGTSLARVYDNNGYFVSVLDPNDPVDTTPFVIDTFTITPVNGNVPEPASLVLLATGAAGMAGMLRRRLARS